MRILSALGVAVAVVYLLSNPAGAIVNGTPVTVAEQQQKGLISLSKWVQRCARHQRLGADCWPLRGPEPIDATATWSRLSRHQNRRRRGLRLWGLF